MRRFNWAISTSPVALPAAPPRPGRQARQQAAAAPRGGRRGAAAKADCEPQRFVREFRGPVDGLSVGQELKVDIFSPRSSPST